MHGSMGGGRRPATVGHAARRPAPLAYPTNLFEPGSRHITRGVVDGRGAIVLSARAVMRAARS
jgi:hypothetical protein